MKRLVLALFLAACASAQKPAAPLEPPAAKRVPHPQVLHGETLPDDWYWLREKGSPEVEQYLKTEAAYADQALSGTLELQEKLYQEMVSRLQETDAAAPFRKDGYWYYTRTEQGKQYLFLARRKGSLEAPEQVLLDVNELARGKKFMQLGAWAVSDDGNLLAYTTDETGFRQYDLHVLDLRTGREGPDRAARVDSLAWSRDDRYLFYVVEDPVAKRPSQLYRHALGAAEDDLVYEEKDEMFGLEVSRSRSRDFLFLTSSSHTTSEVRFFAASDPFATPVVVQPREAGHEYYVDHRGGLLYIRTNSGGRNFRVVTAPVWAPRKEGWKEIVPHSEQVMVLDVDLFRSHLVLHEREGGLPQVVVRDLRTGEERKLPVAEADYDLRPYHNEEWDPKALRIEYQSPLTPKSEYDVDLATLEWTLVKREPVPNYDAKRYQVERVWATARDGTQVPIALVRRTGLARDGRSPLYLYGYGAYGLSLADTFDSRRFSLIDRGVTFAVAHVRGGGEMGKRWHDQGRMMKKMNTFTDFIDCAEWLIAQGYTSRERLAIGGGSAGGLLIGAVLNMRPDLFHAAVAWVPFVDLINTMLDDTLPLTVGEFEEWGNPKKADEYRYMRQYSPYDNVSAQPYPALLVRSSYNDSQVMYWEPAKWVARLRATRIPGSPLLFKINLDPAGHGGASGRYERLRESALDQAFILTQIAR